LSAMDRFHTPSPPGGTVRTLDGMRFSALRLPLLPEARLLDGLL
jgi:hypothetical protein